MKARLLKKILNNTGYTVGNYGDYIAIGSPLCHDLIKVTKDGFKMTYALDTWHKGREALNHPELIFIWDKLLELIASGEIKEIVNGVDEIENPLPVYTCEDGALIATFTDAYGWPNTTIDGIIMHDNTYFKTHQEAIDYGIAEYEATKEHWMRRKKELEGEIQKVCDQIDKYSTFIIDLIVIKAANPNT